MIKLPKELTKLLFNIAHTVITVNAVACWLQWIVGRNFDKAELTVMYALHGGFLGLALAGFWEAVVEEYLLRMPSSKGDVLNMVITGVIAGILASFIIVPNLVLYIATPISIGFILWYFVKMYSTRLSRPKRVF